MVTNIDKSTCKSLREEINAALAAVAARHGISISAGSATFTSSNATFKLNVAVQNAAGTFETAERTAFKNYARSYGLEAADLDKTFVGVHGTMTVVGLKPKSHRYPVLAKSLRDGKTYKFPADYVARALRPVAAPVARPASTTALIGR